MSHHRYIEDDDGELIDIQVFCSDACNRQWCQDNQEEYQGWSGAHEEEFNSYCEQCGVVLGGFAEENQCDHLYPTVVNLIGRPEEERCEHGNIIRAAVRRETERI